jgi:hypothetical protein
VRLLASRQGQCRELRRFDITDKIMILVVVAFSTLPVVYLLRAANL